MVAQKVLWDFIVIQKKRGFENYYGKEEFNNDEFSDEVWGIYDKPFLNFSMNS